MDFLILQRVGLVDMLHTYRPEVVVACHNGRMDREEVEAHNHGKDIRVDHRQVDSSQTGRTGEAEAAVVEGLSFYSHHSHDEQEVVDQ
jgi:hypothetical protein